MATDEEVSEGAEGVPLPFGIVPERPDMDRYLEDTIVVDWQTPAVFEKAKALCEGLSHGEESARALFTFVRDEIQHALDIETDDVTCSASQVLKAGNGLCYAKSHLLAAMLRSRGLPAGFCYQRLLRDDQPGRFVLHGFIAVHLAERARWVLLDARGNRDDVHTEFSLAEPSLAYAPDPERGEATLPVLLTRPGKRVVAVLDQADSLARIRAHLPDRIE